MSERRLAVSIPADAPEPADRTGEEDLFTAARTPRDAVRVAVRAAALLGAPGLVAPGIDETGMATIWTAMIVTVARRCQVDLSPRTAAKIAMSAISGVAAYSLGSKLFTIALAVVIPVMPLAAAPVAMAMNGALNAVFTYKLGKECIQRFSEPGLSPTDILMTGWRLAPALSLSELADFRRLVGGS